MVTVTNMEEPTTVAVLNQSNCPVAPVFNPIVEERVIIPLLLAIIFFVGVIGNLLLIITVRRNKDMQTTPNILIVSLAIGDLLLILFAVPFSMVVYILTDYPFGDAICRMTAFVITLSCGVSVFTLTALSAERYVAILQPMRSFLKSSTNRTLSVAAVIWVVSIGLACFDIFTNFQITRSCGKYKYNFCIPTALDHIGPWFPCFRVSFKLVVYFVVPVTIIAVLYSLMAAKLCHTSLPDGMDDLQTNPAIENQVQARKKVARIILSLVIIFIVCWLPWYVYSMTHNCAQIHFNEGWLAFKVISSSLSFFNSCVNPLALCILSDQFKGYFKYYLTFGCCRRPAQPSNIPRPSLTCTANTLVAL